MDSGAIFDCQKELSAYLKSDVKVLTESMETFASKMLELTGIDPTVECMTIASTAFKVLQTKFLEPYTIALEPLGGWRHNQQNQSVEALQWLEFENAKIGGGIQVTIKNFSCMESLHILNGTCNVLLQISIRELFTTVRWSMHTTNQKLEGNVWEICTKSLLF